jgi:hypothetical protein
MITASWFVDGWAWLAHCIGSAYGPNIPEKEKQRMFYAMKRERVAKEREDFQRLAAGKETIWK